jgi:hypothetical protein
MPRHMVWVHFKFSHFVQFVVGEDTDHGSPPWLVSSPASENLKCTPWFCKQVYNPSFFCIFIPWQCFVISPF